MKQSQEIFTCPQLWNNRKSKISLLIIAKTFKCVFRRLAELEEEVTHKESEQVTKQVEEVHAAEATIPEDFLKKLAETEDLVSQLQQQNKNQREELDNIHNALEKEARMKYRGCNHPSKGFRYRHASNNSSFDGSTRELRARTRNSSQDSQYVSSSRLDLSMSRNSSLLSDRFPPLRALAVPRSRRQR